MKERICPKCGKAYKDIPATSREDGKTLICPDCASRESLAALGIGPEEQDRILADIHKNQYAYLN